MDAADGWSQAPGINYSCGEFYERTFDMNQTLAQLPAGNYEFRLQGFQRPGEQATVMSDYAAGKNQVNATFYAGSKSAMLAHIAKDAPSTVPNSMQTASNCFAKGLYENFLTTSLDADGGSLKIGIKSSNMPAKYWVIFDNFRLLFFGSTTRDALGIKTIDSNRETITNKHFYDLQGRPVKNGQMQRGLYIVNGQKVILQ